MRIQKIICTVLLCMFYPSFLQAGLFDTFRSDTPYQQQSALTVPNRVTFETGDSTFRLNKPSNKSKFSSEMLSFFGQFHQTAPQPVKFQTVLQQDNKPAKLFSLFHSRSEKMTRFVDYASGDGMHACGGSNRYVAAALAIIPPLGGLGVHKYYLGNTRVGIVYTLAGLLVYPIVQIVAIVEGILYLTKSDAEFHSRYCRRRGCIAEW